MKLSRWLMSVWGASVKLAQDATEVLNAVAMCADCSELLGWVHWRMPRELSLIDAILYQAYWSDGGKHTQPGEAADSPNGKLMSLW